MGFPKLRRISLKWRYDRIMVFLSQGHGCVYDCFKKIKILVSQKSNWREQDENSKTNLRLLSWFLWYNIMKEISYFLAEWNFLQKSPLHETYFLVCLFFFFVHKNVKIQSVCAAETHTIIRIKTIRFKLFTSFKFFTSQNASKPTTLFISKNKQT